MNTSTHQSGRTLILVVIAVVLLGSLAAGGAWLLRDDESEKRGDCGTATHELTVESEDGGLEASFELQSSQPGEDWDIVLTHDSDTLVQGTRTTDEDAELDVDAYIDDAEGDDTFTVDFSRTGSGDNCTVSLDH